MDYLYLHDLRWSLCLLFDIFSEMEQNHSIVVSSFRYGNIINNGPKYAIISCMAKHKRWHGAARKRALKKKLKLLKKK